MAQKRVNPFDQGTAERILYQRMRGANLKAQKAKHNADSWKAEYDAESAKAQSYREALVALGHDMDKIETEMLA